MLLTGARRLLRVAVAVAAVIRIAANSALRRSPVAMAISSVFAFACNSASEFIATFMRAAARVT